MAAASSTSAWADFTTTRPDLKLALGRDDDEDDPEDPGNRAIVYHHRAAAESRTNGDREQRRAEPAPRRARSRSPTRRQARDPSPLRDSGNNYDGGDDDDSKEEKKEGEDAAYIAWMRSTRDLTTPGVISAGELKERSSAAGGAGVGDFDAPLDPTQLGHMDDGNPLQPHPIPGTGPPDISALPLEMRAEERLAMSKAPWCFLCQYKRKSTDVIQHEQFGSSYNRLMQFVDTHRHGMKREKFYIQVQKIYNASCRRVLSCIEDRDRYWSILEIYNHFDSGTHDTSYANVVHVEFNRMWALQQLYSNKCVYFIDSTTGRVVVDFKAGREIEKISAKVIKYAAIREMISNGGNSKT